MARQREPVWFESNPLPHPLASSLANFDLPSRMSCFASLHRLWLCWAAWPSAIQGAEEVGASSTESAGSFQGGACRDPATLAGRAGGACRDPATLAGRAGGGESGSVSRPLKPDVHSDAFSNDGRWSSPEVIFIVSLPSDDPR